MRNTILELAGRIRTLLVLVGNILIRAVDIVYPPCCPFCDNELKEKEIFARICKNCQEKMVYITQSFCMKCGKQIPSKKDEYCYDCSRYHHSYQQARSILSYQGKTKEALYRFKKMNRREYAEFFGEEICRLLGAWLYNCRGDCLIPIPLFYKNQGRRGYNQALLIADVISRKIGIPLWENYLLKQSDTIPQKDLDKTERRRNLEKAFCVMPGCEGLVKGKRVILVDDIYTTGATVDAAAKVLREAGAWKVFVITIAIGG